MASISNSRHCFGFWTFFYLIRWRKNIASALSAAQHDVSWNFFSPVIFFTTAIWGNWRSEVSFGMTSCVRTLRDKCSDVRWQRTKKIHQSWRDALLSHRRRLVDVSPVGVVRLSYLLMVRLSHLSSWVDKVRLWQLAATRDRMRYHDNGRMAAAKCFRVCVHESPSDEDKAY